MSLEREERVALREYVIDLMNERDRRYKERFDAQESAQRELKSGTDLRFAGINEFRGALDDAQRTLMPRAEAEARMEALHKNMGELKEQVSLITASGVGVKAGYAWAVAVVVFVLALIREFAK